MSPSFTDKWASSVCEYKLKMGEISPYVVIGSHIQGGYE